MANTAPKSMTADTITDEQILEERDRACECRDAIGFKPRIGFPGDHAAVHDCDVDIYEDCVRALGPKIVLAPGSALDPSFSTWIANAARTAALTRLAEIINAHSAVKP
jgi:hypothetical protein